MRKTIQKMAMESVICALFLLVPQLTRVESLPKIKYMDAARVEVANAETSLITYSRQYK